MEILATLLVLAYMALYALAAPITMLGAADTSPLPTLPTRNVFRPGRISETRTHLSNMLLEMAADAVEATGLSEKNPVESLSLPSRWSKQLEAEKLHIMTIERCGRSGCHA